jgi:hypothetical protein
LEQPAGLQDNPVSQDRVVCQVRAVLLQPVGSSLVVQPLSQVESVV